MNQDKPNLYEGMYIIKATLSDEARHKALDKIQNGITSRSGEIVKVHDQGVAVLPMKLMVIGKALFFTLF